MSELEEANRRTEKAEQQIAELTASAAYGIPVECLTGSDGERATAIASLIDEINNPKPRTPEPDPTQGRCLPVDTGPSDPLAANLNRALSKTR